MTTRDRDEQLDRWIREALDREEAEAYDRLGETSVVQMVFGIFRGPRGWLSVLGAVLTTAFLVLSIYCAFRFYGGGGIEEMLRWGAASAFCVAATMFNKLWVWLEMQRIALSREVKRVELQLAHLTRQLGADRPA